MTVTVFEFLILINTDFIFFIPSSSPCSFGSKNISTTLFSVVGNVIRHVLLCLIYYYLEKYELKGILCSYLQGLSIGKLRIETAFC